MIQTVRTTKSASSLLRMAEDKREEDNLNLNADRSTSYFA